jgi:hypothetical protein
MIDFEIAPEEYWIYAVSYNEAIMYCSQLDIDGKKGWQLPTIDESMIIKTQYLHWYLDDVAMYDNTTYLCVGARTNEKT